MTSRLTLCST